MGSLKFHKINSKLAICIDKRSGRFGWFEAPKQHVNSILAIRVQVSLVPRPHPVFHCCTLKNGRAWYLNNRNSQGHIKISS